MKIKYAKVDSEKYSMEHFDDDVCDLFNKYLGVGFLNSDNEQFFEDGNLVEIFDLHLDGLKTLLEHTRGINRFGPEEDNYDFDFAENGGEE